MTHPTYTGRFKTGVTPEDLPPANYAPDARRHRAVSFIKSGLRILGFVFIPIDLVGAAIILVLAEGLGVLEDLV